MVEEKNSFFVIYLHLTPYTLHPTPYTYLIINNKHSSMESWKLNLKGNWNEVKGKIKQKYANLTDDDLLYEEGKDDELLGRIQKKVGETKEKVKEWIESL